MLIGVKDYDAKHFVFFIPAILAITELNKETCTVRLQYGVAITLHMPVEALMNAFGDAVGSAAARQNLLDAAKSGARQ